MERPAPAAPNATRSRAFYGWVFTADPVRVTVRAKGCQMAQKKEGQHHHGLVSSISFQVVAGVGIAEQTLPQDGERGISIAQVCGYRS